MSELIEVNNITPIEIFTVKGGARSVVDRVKQIVEESPQDISTAEGRKEIASIAYKISRTKTAFDDMGKTLKADLQKQVDAIDAERKAIRDELDTLKDQYRKPLTDFENAEKERISTRELRLLSMQALAQYDRDGGTVAITQALERLADLFDFDWQEFAERAKATNGQIGDFLTKEHAREAEREELIAKQKQAEQERAERERQEREAELVKKAEARAKAEAEQRIEAEKAAAAKAIQEKAEAEERAKKAEEEAEARATAAAERAKEQERARAEAEAARIAKEQADREADIEHRKSINRTIFEELKKLGADEETAKAIVTAMARNQINNVKILY